MLPDHAHEVVKTPLDVGEPGGRSPVALGGEVDDEARPGDHASRPHVHETELEAVVLCGARVTPEHLRVGALELQRDALAHDAHGVDGVDEGVHVGLEEIAVRQRDHAALPHGVRRTSHP